MKQHVSMLLAGSLICSTIVAMQEYELIPTENFDTPELFTSSHQEQIRKLTIEKQCGDAYYSCLVLGTLAASIFNVLCEEKGLSENNNPALLDPHFYQLGPSYNAPIEPILGIYNKANALTTIGLSLADMIWLLKSYTRFNDISSEEKWAENIGIAHGSIGYLRAIATGVLAKGMRPYPRTLAILAATALSDLSAYHYAQNRKKIFQQLCDTQHITNNSQTDVTKIIIDNKSEENIDSKPHTIQAIKDGLRRRFILNGLIALADLTMIGGSISNAYFVERGLLKQSSFFGNIELPCTCPNNATSCVTKVFHEDGTLCQQTADSSYLYIINDFVAAGRLYTGCKEMYDLYCVSAALDDQADDESQAHKDFMETYNIYKKSNIWSAARFITASALGLITTVAGAINGVQEYPRTIAVWGLNAALDMVSAFNWRQNMKTSDELMNAQVEYLKTYKKVRTDKDEDESSDETI